MFLPLKQAPIPPTSPKRLFGSQAVSQTLPHRAWASSEIAAVILGVVLGVIVLIALGYLANHFLRSSLKKLEQSVFDSVQEDLASKEERRNAGFTIWDSQERGPSGRYLHQYVRRRASPSPPPERESNIEEFSSYQVPRSHVRRFDYGQRATPTFEAGQIRRRPDSPYPRPLLHSTTAYHREPFSSQVRRREWEPYTEVLVDAYGMEMPRPQSGQLASPSPRLRGRRQSRQQHEIEGVARIDRTHSARQLSLPDRSPLPPQHGQGVKYMAPQVSSANNSNQSNERYEAGPE